MEDNADDAALLERHLRRQGFLADITRVEQAHEMQHVLDGAVLPDLVLADYNLPTFSGPAALQLMKNAAIDLPFIMLSGEVSEETAVSSMRAGAHDYVSKQNLSRLVPAIHRELKEAETRRNSRAAERALKASEARFHSLVEAMPVGLLLCDAAGHIVYGNRAAERMLQYTGQELAAGVIDSVLVCSSLGAILTAAASDGATIEPFEAICKTRGGTDVDVLIGIAMLNPEAPADDRQVAYFIADLTLQKKSEEVLRRSEKLAIAGRLAASIAHEINNPLEATINCLYLVSKTNLSEEARNYLELAQKELDRVTQITVQTLRFYRSSTRPADTDVHELIETVLALMDSRLRQMRVTVVRDFRANPRIFAHEGEIRQVLANLVSNALDAVGEDGSIVVRTSSARDWKRDRLGMAITVADDGIGMDEATRKRIFEPFFSTKGATGTGLGLWVSHEIAGKHQGRIRLRSREKMQGQRGGTVFRFFLPALDDGAIASPDESV